MKQRRDGFNMELKFVRLRRYLGRLAFIAELRMHVHAKRARAESHSYENLVICPSEKCWSVRTTR